MLSANDNQPVIPPRLRAKHLAEISADVPLFDRGNAGP
jgi:hypothetical protein